MATAARAVAVASWAESYPASVIAWLWNSSSLRLNCAVALSSCALATARLACACVRLFCGILGSTLASSWPRFTSSPVCTGIWRISPEALDFTLKVRIGWITPDAVADTTMSRRATGTAW